MISAGCPFHVLRAADDVRNIALPDHEVGRTCQVSIQVGIAFVKNKDQWVMNECCRKGNEHFFPPESPRICRFER